MSIYLAAGIALTLGGLALLVVALAAGREAHASAAWPSTPGKIIASRLSTPRGTLFGKRDLNLSYIYDVDGKHYSGSRVMIGLVPRRELSDLAQRYEAGRTVDIFYDLERPGRSVLEHGLRNEGALMGAVGLAGIELALGLCLIAFGLVY